MEIVIWSIAGFLLGALPLSYWAGRIMARDDIRRYGDGNPGAVNAFKAGGWKSGAPALVLDYLKGAIPVGLAHFAFQLQGWGLLPVALTPILGHAVSPLLGFRGGKAVTVTFGVWTGLLLWEGPTVLGIALGCFILLQVIDAWSVILAMLTLILYSALRQFDAVILVTGAGTLLILTWKHWADLQQLPRLRPWLVQLFRR